METKERLRRLFSYDLWANEQIADTLHGHTSFSNAAKSINLYAHIAASQQMWYRRIEDQPFDDLQIWPDYDLSIALQKLKKLSEKWYLLIKGYPDLDKMIRYTNSKGTAYNTMLSDILHHLIIHGQHHRAQIAVLLRHEGITPPTTDFIAFTRISHK